MIRFRHISYVLIIETSKNEEDLLSKNLTELLEYLRKMMRSDVMDEPLAFLSYNGWSDEEIRERSHHPDKILWRQTFYP